MLGTLVNACIVIVGSALGLFLRRELPESLKNLILHAVGLLTISIGITMVTRMHSVVSLAMGLLIGSILGELVDLEHAFEIFAERIRGFAKGEKTFVEGMITAFVTFCVGPMTIIGSIEDGLGNPSILLTKSILDCFMAITYASAMGIGVAFSVVPLVLYQGSISLLAHIIKPYISAKVLQDLTACGGLLLIGLGINILGITKIRILNMLPSLLIVSIISYIL